MGKTKGIHIEYNPLSGEFEDMTKQYEDDAYQYEEWKNSKDYVDMVNQEFAKHKPKYSEADIDNAIKNGFASLVVTSEEVGIEVYEKLFRQHFNEALDGI
tara:strand:+ start:195 stop:494 length:300 start_codon:yes stop_codon:yes gene_type:complete